MAVLGGLGAILSVGGRLCRLGTQPKKTRFSCTSAPTELLGRKIAFSRFWPRISSSAKGSPRPKGPRKPLFCDFPPLRVRSADTQNVKKKRNFWEKLFRADGFPPQKCP